MIYNSRTEIEILQWSIVPVVTTINTEIYVLLYRRNQRVSRQFLCVIRGEIIF